uniref:Letm1 RBD domain-containing protein n=1 Tax=Tetradesmus obliquus TaxID=3088 RepID=A0A383VBJ9_TETOB|eukprot:jgi/Sobl393_1/15479/SZX61726.1
MMQHNSSQSLVGQRAGVQLTPLPIRRRRTCAPTSISQQTAKQVVVSTHAVAVSRPWNVSSSWGCNVARLQQCKPLQAANSALEQAPAAAAAAPAGPPRLLTGMSAQRVQRLETLVELKKLYRNCIRAEALLGRASPVYVAPEGAADGTCVPALDDDAYSSMDSSSSTSLDDEVAERLQQAVELVAEMQLTAEQLKTGLRALPASFGAIFGKDSSVQTAADIRDTAKRYSGELRDRAAVELPLLPFSSEMQAQAACDVRNARYNKRLQAVVDELGAESPSSSISSTSSLPDRLNQAEKVAGKFVARRIKPALQRAREKELGQVLSESGQYLRGLWARLNGGGGRRPRALPPALVQPPSSKKDVERRISELTLQLESLEKRLVEASKAREAKLRKAGAAGRVAVAIQLRSMDAEVIAISRLLAVRTLQLEMEYIYASLEEEAIDVSADELLNKGPAIVREGSTGELALLVAEYGLLLEQLDVLAASIDSQMAATGSSSNSHMPGSSSTPTAAAATAAASGPGVSLIDEDILEELAAEIPDLRYRVGVPDAEVFGSNPLSPTRLKLQARESQLKVFEGLNFLLRGMRLLGSDVGNAGRLFTKAALGGTLKAREVAALRRTARDLLTFIPFIIILIIPLTPLGHVLVFGFIQRYFPGFFPSQFTNQRQDLMMRYEELQRQLATAQAAAEVEEEEAELARAAAAVARLTAPDIEGCVVSSGPSSSGSPGDSSSVASTDGGVERQAVLGGVAVEEGGPAAAKVRLLEEQLEEARAEVHSAPDDDSPQPVSVRH